MKNTIDLFNAAMIGENPDASFLLQTSGHLHAVEKMIADYKAEKKEKQILEKIREAHNALIQFSHGKVEPHFLDVEPTSFSNEVEETSYLITQIHSIYTHLPHYCRNELSSLVHHKQPLKRK